MPLVDGQVQVAGLVMGPGTPYRVLGFNPWSRSVRADQGGKRAWGHGAWSGAEWADEVTVPMTIRVLGTDVGSWLEAHQALAAAFAPRHDDTELRFALGGREYLMFGRPRMVEPQVRALGTGAVTTRCAFAALDPHIYSGEEHSVSLGLPSTTGGLTVPITVPLTVPAIVSAGRRPITNTGTADVGLRLRIDGPVVEPHVSLLTPAGTATLRFWLTLDVDQWLDVDTGARTVYLNGVASRRGLTTVSGIGWPTLPPGTHEISFGAPTYSSPDARLTVTWRDAWW